MAVIFEYNLTQQCGSSRPFCYTCTNSFTARTCGNRVNCETVPVSQICLEPYNPNDCSECSSITAIGLNNLKVSDDLPSDWNGSFGMLPSGTCNWLGRLPTHSEAETTYYNPAICANPLIGKWTVAGTIHMIPDTLLPDHVFSILISVERYFLITARTGNPACHDEIGTKIDRTISSTFLGGIIIGPDCGHGTFEFEQLWPIGIGNTASVST